MTQEFDPYYKWLGIPPKHQPPNHYRLLGIELFEPDREVIDAAANRVMAHLKALATGDDQETAQKLLNEVSRVRLCLLNPTKKAAYDEQLKAKQTLSQKVIPRAKNDLGPPTPIALPLVSPPVVLPSRSPAGPVGQERPQWETMRGPNDAPGGTSLRATSFGPVKRSSRGGKRNGAPWLILLAATAGVVVAAVWMWSRSSVRRSAQPEPAAAKVESLAVEDHLVKPGPPEPEFKQPPPPQQGKWSSSVAEPARPADRPLESALPEPVDQVPPTVSNDVEPRPANDAAGPPAETPVMGSDDVDANQGDRLPEGMRGFRGTFLGEVVSKDNIRGTFVAKVIEIKQVAKENQAKNPQSAVGEPLNIQVLPESANFERVIRDFAAIQAGDLMIIKAAPDEEGRTILSGRFEKVEAKSMADARNESRTERHAEEPAKPTVERPVSAEPPRPIRYERGIVIRAEGGGFRNIVGTRTVPMPWPEQQAVRVIKEEVPPRAKIAYNTLDNVGRQMIVQIPFLEPGQEARVVVTFEIQPMSTAPLADPTALRSPVGSSQARKLAPYLAPSPFSESDARGVQQLAAEVAEGRTSDWEKVQAIHAWVKANIKFSPGAGKEQGAAQTLRGRVFGDDADPKSLAVALCRAQRIPARLVLIARPGASDHCYYEFYLVDDEGNGHWLAADDAVEASLWPAKAARSVVLQKGGNVTIIDPESKRRVKHRFLADSLQGMPQSRSARLQLQLISRVIEDPRSRDSPVARP